MAPLLLARLNRQALLQSSTIKFSTEKLLSIFVSEIIIAFDLRRKKLKFVSLFLMEFMVKCAKTSCFKLKSFSPNKVVSSEHQPCFLFCLAVISLGFQQFFLRGVVNLTPPPFIFQEELYTFVKQSIESMLKVKKS